MKKYFSILVAVLFATLSLTLTACSDDDEEGEDNYGGANTLVINGEKYFDDNPEFSNIRTNVYSFSYYPASYNEDAELSPIYHHLEINIHSALKSGMNIPFDDVYSFSMAISTEYRYQDMSGNIKVVSASDKTITLSFENCKCTRDDGWDITINGTVTFNNIQGDNSSEPSDPSNPSEPSEPSNPSEPSDPSNPSSSLVGKWTCTNADVSSSLGVVGGMKVGDYMEFNSNGTCKWTEQGVVITAKYKYQSNKISISDISDDSIPMTYEVKTLNEKALTISANLGIVVATYSFSRAS